MEVGEQDFWKEFQSNSTNMATEKTKVILVTMYCANCGQKYIVPITQLKDIFGEDKRKRKICACGYVFNKQDYKLIIGEDRLIIYPKKYGQKNKRR